MFESLLSLLLKISLDEIICRDTELLGDSEHILRCTKNILTVHATFAALITVELERIIDANQHLTINPQAFSCFPPVSFNIREAAKYPYFAAFVCG